MNAVEIEEAISALAEQPYDGAEFAFDFLLAFGNKSTTLKRLRSGTTNKSDLGGVLQTNNIHIVACDHGTVGETLTALRTSPATTKAKAKFILATDGQTLEAEDVNSGETIACDYPDFHDHFRFFLPLAGISTVTQIRESAFDIKATGRLNRLYIELLKDNPDWGTAERRHDMNHFMARLIFLFFAEDTSILKGDDLFTTTVTTMSAKDSSNTDWVISELFRAMNVDDPDRAEADLPNWADKFPYVNGGLFSGSTDVPKFSKIARSYLLHIGSLDWTKINPDIFGSMIQAVADDEERGALGMHYTSVPNILKVLNPLFLDDLRAQLDAAGDNKKKLKTLRTRIAKIRVFDPACGSGNFLVIAYKEMREIEAKINAYSGEADRCSDIPLTNYRGIELLDFPAEIARLALIIAEYQCDVTYRGHKDALAAFLPLDAENWITQGNALRLDWLTVCPPTEKTVEMRGEDLFMFPLEKAQIDFKNEGGETYICGNPPYKGTNWRTKQQTAELNDLLDHRCRGWKALDYVCGWLVKATDYAQHTTPRTSIAFVTTNSICQGIQASLLWPLVFRSGLEIQFAHTSFKWANLAAHNAGVSVVVVGMSPASPNSKVIFGTDEAGDLETRKVPHINAYLLNAPNTVVSGAKVPLGFDAFISDGSGALDGRFAKFVRPYLGSNEFIKGSQRWCLWIEDEDLDEALQSPEISKRISKVKEYRLGAGTRAKTAVSRSHKFAWVNKSKGPQIIVPTVFSEKRAYVTAGFVEEQMIINNNASVVQNPKLHTLAIVSSLLHMAWVRAIAGKLEDRIRYTSTTCFNTFPVPKLTEKNRVDLTRCAQDILLAREAHFPATIADLYKPDAMPANLRAAHDRNDEVLERIYIGRRFRNDTERLEKLFELYTQMTTKVPV